MPPGLDRNEFGALLVAGGLDTAAEHTLIWLLVLNALRVPEAAGADIGAMGVERGHRAPWSPCHSWRTVARLTWVHASAAKPVFLAPIGRRLDRRGAARIDITYVRSNLGELLSPKFSTSGGGGV
jgi:hypothetical protein